MTTRTPIIPVGDEGTYDRFHFAPATKVDDTVYVSGVIGRGSDGRVPPDPDAEFAAAFAKLAATLEAAGAVVGDIVDLTSFHTDMPDSLGAFITAKDAAIGAPYPAWTAIGCTALAVPGARVEIKAIAVIGSAS